VCRVDVSSVSLFISNLQRAEVPIAPEMVFLHDRFTRSKQYHAKEHISDSSKTPKIITLVNRHPRSARAKVIQNVPHGMAWAIIRAP
jgi:hypothetical protein